jgi:type II secretory pathway pseudopilin PulG
MIKFFRKIRYDLMGENKTGKYLKYAFGEIVLVVIGILIALSINNWNETRKLELKKQELILNLIDDFQENIVQLKPAIAKSDSLSYKMNTFFDNAYLSNLKISIDSLKVLNDGFFRPVYFFPSMVSYDEAKANGNLTILKNKELFKNFLQFQQAYITFRNFQDQGRESFFKGPTWELKKTIGSLSLLRGGKKRNYIKNIDEVSYIKLINLTIATAAFENQYTINRNTYEMLKEMDLISKNIVKSLTELKK